MEWTLSNLTNGYVDLVDEVIEFGEIVTVRGERTYEVRDASIFFIRLDDAGPLLPIGVGRGVNSRLAAIEALQLIAGDGRPDLIWQAAPQYRDVLVSTSRQDFWNVAYGPRVNDSLRHVIELLHRDPETRQAVISIWNDSDITRDGDRPCTLALQFMIRDECLHLTTTMRSNDVWLGLTYDVFQFTQLQWTVLNWLRALGMHHLKIGTYTHHANSLHAYERDRERIGKLQHRDDPRAMVDSLPRGIVGDIGFLNPDEVPEYSFQDAADLMLQVKVTDDSDRNSLLTLNPWYAAQLAKLGETP